MRAPRLLIGLGEGLGETRRSPVLPYSGADLYKLCPIAIRCQKFWFFRDSSIAVDSNNMSLEQRVRAFMEGMSELSVAAEWSELHAFVDNSEASRDTIVSAWLSVSETLLQRCHSEGVSTCRRGIAVCNILFRALSAIPGEAAWNANRRETAGAAIHRTQYVIMAILRATPKRKRDGTWVNVDIERLFVEEANLHIQDLRAAEELAVRQENEQRERQERERQERERQERERRRERQELERRRERVMQRARDARRAEAIAIEQARADAEEEEASSDCYFDLHKASVFR